jgi:Ala-tRNA(Pro) deacylase
MAASSDAAILPYRHPAVEDPMPTTRAELFAYLDTLGVVTTTVDHEAVFTVEQSEQLHRDIPGAHTKNLFLKDAKGAFFLVVAEAHSKVELKSLHKTIGCARLSFGNADLLMQHLGITPGSVNAFAVMNDTAGKVSVILDETLRTATHINCHPMTNTATTSIARADLLTFMEATGHAVQWLGLSGAISE